MRRKPKPYIEAGLKQLIPVFTKLCALDKIPYLTFSRAEVKKLGLHGYSNLLKNSWGKCWLGKNVIWINPRHTNIDEARKTLAHEFIHLRFSYPHGEKFEEKIKLLLRGEQFKPKRIIM